jgi:hypothetical protein
VSGPRFSDDLFLTAAIERYDNFLRLMGSCGYRKHFYVPSYDVDLVWHTHMLSSPCAYHEETRLRAGEPVDHDDSVDERHEGSKLNTSWNNTKKLWWQTFGASDTAAALDAGEACYRGEPPRWWFKNRRHEQRVFVHDGVVTEAFCQRLVAQIKGSQAAGPDSQDLELSLDVPSSLHEAILSTLQGGGAQQVACMPSEGGDAHVVPVPAKLSVKAVPFHKVAFGCCLPSTYHHRCPRHLIPLAPPSPLPPAAQPLPHRHTNAQPFLPFAGRLRRQARRDGRGLLRRTVPPG